MVIIQLETHISKLTKHIIIVIYCLFISVQSHAQGLKFYDSEYPIDERTSYNVFNNKPPTFINRFDIEFDIALYTKTQIGYTLRIKNREDNNIYNLFYDGQGPNLIFKFNKEGHNSLISAEIKRDDIADTHWFRLKISFDLKNDSIKLRIHNQTFGLGGIDLPDKFSPITIFGKSDYIIDVPSFAIKNLSIGNDKKYTFELHESEGNVVHDTKGKAVGSVLSPEWLINDSYKWKLENSFSSKTVAGANYNPGNKNIYYFNRDCINIYNVWSKELQVINFEHKCPVDMHLGTNFLDVDNNKLYVYEVYDDSSQDCTTLASLDLQSHRWTPLSQEQLPTQLHHHAAFFDNSTQRYTIFGGFGNMRYSDSFYNLDIKTGSWKRLSSLAGETPFPRYFSSMGYVEKENSIYVFGGMGNESGEQVVGRNYLYDLHKIDLNTNVSTKLWEITPRKNNMVPVRSMLIIDDSSFYTLCYPESISESFLRLYKFSIKDGSYKILGDSIPIHSDKITTNANIYYDHQLKNIYVTVQEFDDDIMSKLTVYSLAFPPLTADELKNYSQSATHGSLIFIILILVVSAAIGGYLLVRRARRRAASLIEKSNELRLGNQQSSEPPRANSLYLFGDFMVRDRNNRDITYMFSARLKQTLCLILQYSSNDGISSQRLSSLLWPDKNVDKVKNLRSVTINHLRKTLCELDGVELVHEKSCFKIVHTEAFYCDYIKCFELVSANVDSERVDKLTRILKRGKFLCMSNEPLFDSFKETLEHTLEPILLSEMQRSFAAKKYHNTINLAQAEFNIDPSNDEALGYMLKSLHRLKMNEEVRIRYRDFTINYKKTIGSDYPHSIKSLL